MHLEADDRPVQNVLLRLQRPEAEQLRQDVKQLLDHFDEPGWHAHTSSSDFQAEVTVVAEADG